MKDLYFVTCPKCGINHHTILENTKQNDKNILCKKCKNELEEFEIHW